MKLFRPVGIKELPDDNSCNLNIILPVIQHLL
jgi:hypothetical protein